MNRLWYSTDDRHAHHSWKTRFILAILRFGVTNSFVTSDPSKSESYVFWRTSLAKELVKNGWQK
jgi:hypothetical protein